MQVLLLLGVVVLFGVFLSAPQPQSPNALTPVANANSEVLSKLQAIHDEVLRQSYASRLQIGRKKTSDGNTRDDNQAEATDTGQDGHGVRIQPYTTSEQYTACAARENCHLLPAVVGNDYGIAQVKNAKFDSNAELSTHSKIAAVLPLSAIMASIPDGVVQPGQNSIAFQKPQPLDFPDRIKYAQIDIGLFSEILPAANQNTVVLAVEASVKVIFQNELPKTCTESPNCLLLNAAVGTGGLRKFLQTVRPGGDSLIDTSKAADGETWPMDAGFILVPTLPMSIIINAIPENLPLVNCKIDTNGNDLEALKSAGDVIKRCHTVDVEVIGGPVGARQVTINNNRSDVVSHMESMGFYLSCCHCAPPFYEDGLMEGWPAQTPSVTGCYVAMYAMPCTQMHDLNFVNKNMQLPEEIANADKFQCDPQNDYKTLLGNKDLEQEEYKNNKLSPEGETLPEV